MNERLDGLDFARFIAFVGMVIVNFNIAMGGESSSGGLVSLIIGSLEGKAAATFVVLAGIGLGLESLRSDSNRAVVQTIKRAVFLLLIGLLNSLIFDADILHYYAFYFLFGVFCIRLSTIQLVSLTVVCNLIFVAMVFLLDYDTGWDWVNYTYADFWQPQGFIRNLFFNGWHPVFPWLSFLFFGILLSRLQLKETTTQLWLFAIGSIAFLAAEILSGFFLAQLGPEQIELSSLLTTAPVPPMPLYMIAGMGVASVVIAICLSASGWLERVGLLKLVIPAGRQTLTLYIAHILIGMGTLEALGMLGNQSSTEAMLAALMFCLAATVYAWAGSKIFRRGPVEWVMRKLTG